MRIERSTVLAVVLVAMAVPAAAEEPTPPRVSASIGAGLAMPLHGDLSFNAGAWQASVRAAVSPHFLIEGFYGEWRHSTERVATGAIVHGPDSVLGRIDRVTQRTEYVSPTIGFNLLGAGSVGRVTFSAGGGPGMLLYRRHYTQIFEGCQGNVSCGSTDSRFSSASFSVQAAGGLDVAIASRIGAFGEFRVTVPLEDVGSGQTAVVGGLRFTIW